MPDTRRPKGGEMSDFITQADYYAEEFVDDEEFYITVRNAFIHGYQARANEEKEGIAKLHAEIAELKKQLNKAHDPYAD